MGPEEALQSRLDLIDCLLDERQAWAYESWALMREADAKPGDPETRYTTEAIRYTLTTALGMSDTYWVAPQMVDLLEQAAETMPNQPLEDAHLPGPMGYVRLARPITLPLDASVETTPEVNEKTMRGLIEKYRYSEQEARDIVAAKETSVQISAFTWVDFAALIRESGFEDENRPAEGLMVSAFFRSYDDVFVKPVELADLRAVNLPAWMLLDTYMWQYGDNWAMDNWTKKPSDQNGAFGTVFMSRLLATFWTFIDMELTDVSTRRAPRGFARRAQRAGQPSEIKVVTLRRRHTHSESTGDAPVNWSHRWPVEGHWRRQPWGPGRTLRRLQYIPTFIKGPEDKPLVLKNKVYSWQR